MDYWTSCEYDDEGNLTHMIRWQTFEDGTAIEIARKELTK